jgi:hypothetical protein
VGGGASLAEAEQDQANPPLNESRLKWSPAAHQIGHEMLFAYSAAAARLPTQQALPTVGTGRDAGRHNVVGWINRGGSASLL